MSSMSIKLSILSGVDLDVDIGDIFFGECQKHPEGGGHKSHNPRPQIGDPPKIAAYQMYPP